MKCLSICIGFVWQSEKDKNIENGNARAWAPLTWQINSRTYSIRTLSVTEYVAFFCHSVKYFFEHLKELVLASIVIQYLPTDEIPSKKSWRGRGLPRQKACDLQY
jgi:hypothetical protein